MLRAFPGLCSYSKAREIRQHLLLPGAAIFFHFSLAVTVTPDTHTLPLSAAASRFPGGRQGHQQGPGHLPSALSTSLLRTWQQCPPSPLPGCLKGALLFFCPVDWFSSFPFGQTGIMQWKNAPVRNFGPILLSTSPVYHSCVWWPPRNAASPPSSSLTEWYRAWFTDRALNLLRYH